MTIVDVDAHFEPAGDWLDSFPELRDRLPELYPGSDPRFVMNSPEMFAYFVSDDLLRGVPADKRMPIEALVTPAMRMLYDPERPAGVGYEGACQHLEMRDTAARVEWMDHQGIAVQNLISGTGYTLARAIEDPVVGCEALTALNTWMAEASRPHRDRLLPVVSMRFDDLDWAVGELERTRALGCRAFLIGSEPVGNVPPNHPSFDRLWSAATDLGMIALLHVGMSPSSYHPGWANTDDPALIRLISVLQPQQTAQVFLNAMVFGGVFERHPKLTVLMSELGIDWLAGTVDKMDSMAGPGVSPLVLGSYRLPQAPSDYVRQNIRISPLPAERESPHELLKRLPGVAVFSSDYPHFEGNPDPVGYYDEALIGVESTVKEAFFSGNILDAYVRMGDPLLP